MEPRCAACGSKRVQALAGAVGCEDCGAATDYSGELVHDPTDAEPGRVSGPGGEGALPPSAPQNPGQDGITTTENVIDEEDDDSGDDDLDDLSKDELAKLAAAADISGRSTMTKDELVEALRG